MSRGHGCSLGGQHLPTPSFTTEMSGALVEESGFLTSLGDVETCVPAWPC